MLFADLIHHLGNFFSTWTPVFDPTLERAVLGVWRGVERGVRSVEWGAPLPLRRRPP